MRAANDSTSTLQVSEHDLVAYALGDLVPERRRAIEGYLACNPDVAAGVMQRLHMARPGKSPRVQRLVLVVATGVLMATLGLGAGWMSAELRASGGWREADGQLPPRYLEDAAEAADAVRVRDRMHSQDETPLLDKAEIRRVLKVEIPALPASWKVKDVQVFPTDEGPAVTVSVETSRNHRVELFAVSYGDGRPDAPELAFRNGQALAFWETGPAAYVLSGPQSPKELLADALSLSRNKGL